MEAERTANYQGKIACVRASPDPQQGQGPSGVTAGIKLSTSPQALSLGLASQLQLTARRPRAGEATAPRRGKVIKTFIRANNLPPHSPTLAILQLEEK